MLSLNLLHYPSINQYGTIYLTYKSITTIDFVPPRFTNIQKLYLNHNKLVSLAGIEVFENLKVLHIRFNDISEFDELKRIKNPFFMESIALMGNPLEFDKRCREENLKCIFKNLKELNPSYVREKEKEYQMKVMERRIAENSQKKIDQCENEFEEELHKTPDKTFSLKSDGTGKINSYSSKQAKQDSPLIVTKRFNFSNYQSTKNQSNHSLPLSSLQSKHLISVSPFLSPPKSRPTTARFKPDLSLNQNSELTIDFIDQQNQYLAEAFYWRSLIEKCFAVMKRQVCRRGEQFYVERLKLKGWICLKASLNMRKIEREYSQKKERIISAILNQSQR